MTKSQGSPFFVVMRRTCAGAPAHQPVFGADENETIGASDDVPIQRRTCRVERNRRFDPAVPHQHDVSR